MRKRKRVVKNVITSRKRIVVKKNELTRKKSKKRMKCV